MITTFRYWDWDRGVFKPSLQEAFNTSVAVRLNGQPVDDDGLRVVYSVCGFGYVDLLVTNAHGGVQFIDGTMLTRRRWGVVTFHNRAAA